MAVNVEDKIAGLDLARRRKVEERAKELIAEEMTRREPRKDVDRPPVEPTGLADNDPGRLNSAYL